MSYREEYLRYVKRELNDSFIKDGRTIEYKPHYHSFDEWCKDIWNDYFLQEEIDYFFRHLNKSKKYRIIRINWTEKTLKDYNMWAQWLRNNKKEVIRYDEKSLINYNLPDWFIKEEKFTKELSMKLFKEWIVDVKKDFKNWKLFDEFLRGNKWEIQLEN